MCVRSQVWAGECVNETAGFSSLEQDVACLPLILTHENTTVHNYNHTTINNPFITIFID